MYIHINLCWASSTTPPIVVQLGLIMDQYHSGIGPFACLTCSRTGYPIGAQRDSYYAGHVTAFKTDSVLMELQGIQPVGSEKHSIFKHIT